MIKNILFAVGFLARLAALLAIITASLTLVFVIALPMAKLAGWVVCLWATFLGVEWRWI